MTVINIETLADLICNEREWVRRQAIYTLEEALPSLAEGHHDTIQNIINALQKRLPNAPIEAYEKIKGLIEIMENIIHQPA